MNDKNRETQLTAEFADLIQTLERPEAKPYAPSLAQEEKMKLRRQLLVQEERPFLTRQAVGNLWRFAGTAVFLALVIIIGAYFWGAMSNPGQAGPGPVAAPQPTAMSEPTVVPKVTAVTNGSIKFDDDLVPTEPEMVPLPDGTNVILNWEEVDSDNRIWLIAFTQKERPSPTSPIEFEVTLGYDLVSETEEDVFLKLAYAHPDWQTVGGNSRVPVDDTGDLVILDPNRHTISLTFTGSPAEIEQITGTDAPVFMAQMGYMIEHDDARGREFVFLATETFDSYRIDLTSTDTISAGMDELEVSDVMPVPGSTITVTEPIPFLISVDYDIRSAPTVLMDAILYTLVEGQRQEVISGTLALEAAEGGGGLTLYITPELAQSLPEDPAELVLQVQLRLEGEERPFLIRQPEDYYWIIQR